MRTRLLGLSIIAAMLAVLLALVGVAGATPSDKDKEAKQGASDQRVEAAAVTEQEITSDGPITRINIDDELQNDVDYKDVEQTYPDESATHLAVDDTTFGARGDISFTPLSQKGVTGSGTQKDPFEIVTKVAAADTGLTLTQTDTYVEGRRSYNTNIKVSNKGTEAVEATLYRYVDCEVGVPEQDDPDGGIDDGGFGNAYPKTGSAACIEAVGVGEPGNNLLGLRPLSKGSRYQQGERRSVSETDGVIEKVEQQRPFSSTVDKDYVDDNAVGLSWRITVPAGGSVTASSIMDFTEKALTDS